MMDASDQPLLEFDLAWSRGEFQLQASACMTERVTGLSGPSGSGKSVLLALLSGLYRPDRGWIRFKGRTLVDCQQGIFLPAEKRKTGLMLQDALLFPHLSVQKNLLYGYHRCSPGRRFLEPEKIIALLQIGHLLARKPRFLSGGEKQRVALGRALLYSPEILLLDEPLSSLDIERKQQILPFLVEVRDQLQLPMLYVSHAPEEVDYLAEHCWKMEAGRLHT